MNERIKESLDKINSSFWGFFINRRPVAWLAAIAIVIAGLTSLSSLPREIQPEINIPFVSVSTVLPGANPTDTETLLTEPLEKEIANISNIKVMSSGSGFGFSSIFIEFEASADIDASLQEVKDAVDIAKREFPDDTLEPTVTKAEANAFSIVTFSLTGEGRSLYELSFIAEDVKDELEQITGVSDVITLGDQEKYIEIILDQEKLEGYGLNINTVSQIIELANNNIPVGIISSDKINYSIRIDNRFNSLEDIRNIVIFTTPDESNTPILLKDVATIEETLPAQNVISKVSVNANLSLPAVSLQIFKKDKGNIVQIVDDAQSKVEELKKDGTIPKDISIEVTNDNSVFITEELGNLSRNGLQTAFLITIILFLALGLSQGIIAGLSIPLIFLIAFIVMDLYGLTLNTLSLFSLVISLGLVVDTTIVIMEGIYENLKHGLTPREAALMSVHTYKWPLIAGTMTTIFAFFPMLLVSGILGEFLKTLPITISAALFASLFVALTIAPSITTKFVKTHKGDKKRHSLLEPIFAKIGAKFHDFIHYIIQKRTYRVTIILIALGAFALSMSLPITGALKVEMFSQTDQNYFIVQIETPKGIVVEETQKVAEKVEQYFYSIPEVTNFLTNIGTSQSVAISDDPFFSTSSTESNLANITVNLTEKDEREKPSYEIAKEARDHFKHFSEAKVSILEIDEGPPSDAAVTVRITGKELGKLQEISTKVEQIINDIPGTANVEQSLNPGLDEFKFSLDKDRLAFHGLSSIQVSALIRNIIQGIRIEGITLEGEDVNVFVKYDLAEKNNKTNISIQDIENFEIQTPKGYSIPLSELGTYEFEKSLSSIAREDQKRIIKVTSDVEKDVIVADIDAKIKEKIETIELPIGYNIKLGGDLEEIQESFRELFTSMGVAIILIAFTLVLMFNSFRQPLIILFTLPLAMIGVFPGLMSVGLKLSFPAFLGVVALVGIVVNDAIVLIDRINANRKNKEMDFPTAIAEASNARLQPIIMTSITTIVGILPLALTNEFWAGLGFSLIFGLATSTLLTLIVIPVLYYALEGRQERKRLKKLAEV